MRSYNRDKSHQQKAGKLGGKVRGEQMKEQALLFPNLDFYEKKDGRHTHRVVAEACLGRLLNPGEVVHHEDLNKRNNHPSNLIVFPSQAIHVAHHRKGHCGDPCDCPGIRLGVMPE
jgi:hypothetical protein